MTDIDDFAIRIASLVHCMGADQKTRHLFDWFLCRRQTDSLKRSA